jgi:hypothetical protein
MNDLVTTIRIKTLLNKSHISPTDNFESIYANLKDNKLREIIEQKVYKYFNKLSLPKSVTLYDRLLLALRKKDYILTFNWDPFLLDTYIRNEKYIDSLPSIYFLHGNVRAGFCEEDKFWGRIGDTCIACTKNYNPIPLLYPVEKKNYQQAHHYIAKCWEDANDILENAFNITIFGYGAPSSDVEAVSLLKKAWFKKSERQFERVEVIDIIDSSTCHDRWHEFIPTGHLDPVQSFEKSKLWLYPRRICEAMFHPMWKGQPSEIFPLTNTDNLDELHNCIRGITKYE